MNLLLIALLSQSPAPGPDARAIEAAISRPRLQHCDEIACYYRPARNFAVRAEVCEPAPAPGDVVCTYERMGASPVRPIDPGVAPPPDTRIWSLARTEFRATGATWFVIRDSDD